MRAIVCGGIATFPVGGVAWDYGQYALGLERLGVEVYYLEDTGIYAYDGETREYAGDGRYGAEFLGASLALLSPTLAERWHVRSYDGTTYGVNRGDFEEIVREADLFLNVSGLGLLRQEYMGRARRVLIDTDPGWNHFVVFPRQDAKEPTPGIGGFRDHHDFLTYATRIGTPGCSLPDLGLQWKTTIPPVVLDQWPVTTAPVDGRWTTILSWDNYQKPIEHEGRTYGSKDLEFPLIQDLPSATSESLELAVGGVQPPLDRFRSCGWEVVDSPTISATPDSYRRYITRSRGEVSVAKNVYVATHSGWFSCRSTCYLAAGRPVVVQDTGFEEWLNGDSGVLTFCDATSARIALERASKDYEEQCGAARAVAERVFASDVVLADMLSKIGMG